MNNIILASASPRRKELLEREGIDFIIDASSIDEVIDESLCLEDKLIKLAIDKATPIHHKYPDDIVISADTIVYANHSIIGKAKDINEAKEILKMLSNDKHSVYSAVCIYFKNERIAFVDCTDVYFKNIDHMIDEYLSHDEWIGKAGAYAIQGKANVFIDHIEGDLDNVIGLPVYKVLEELKKRHIIR